MIKTYDKAEIYITRCNHPDYSFIKYVGLDTKHDANYIGSSVVLKWLVSLIGRKWFYKEILEVSSGTMIQLCRLEQQHILQHNAVKDPEYLNLNGGRVSSDDGVGGVSLEYLANGVGRAGTFISILTGEVTRKMNQCTFRKSQLVSIILGIGVYGHLRYEQEVFEYNTYAQYGTGSLDAVNEVLDHLTMLGYIDKFSGSFTITNKLIEAIPCDVGESDFQIGLRDIE